jgi:hypothetical protein
MRYFVQLKDDVVFNFHSSDTEVDIPGDNIIQVESDGEKFLNKKYVNGSFVEAPIIKYAILNGSTVERLESTLFASDVNGVIISSDDVAPLWTWDGSEFHPPVVFASVPIIVAEEVSLVEPSTGTSYTPE